MILWSRLVASKPYLKSDMESFLDTHVPVICEQYIVSRLEFARGCVHDDTIDNPLEHRETLDEQLEALPQLVHSAYEKIGQVFTALFDPLVIKYREALQTKNSSVFEELEAQLTWLIYMFGAVIGKRYVSSGTTEDSEVIDANLSARVFDVIPLITERVQIDPEAYDEDSVQYLEASMMYFMKHFKRVYLGDTMVTHTKVYTRLSELLPQLVDQLHVLNLFINKIATNLKIWAKCENIVKLTIALFDDIATGYSSAKQAIKLDSTKFILKNHGIQTFPFLSVPGNQRYRTTFYHTLCKFLFLSDFTEEDFIDFMRPLEAVCIQLEAINNPEMFRRDDVKYVLIGWLRDLRGICTGCATKKNYSFLFDWLYPNHIKILNRATEVFFNDPQVMNCVLKFLAEFVSSKNSRITFGSNSPNGFLLFKETSDLLCTYGTRILNVPVQRDMYDERYKGIHVAMTVLARSLSGNFCNFGVFKLYNDNSLIKVLDTIIRLSLSIPLKDIVAYPKICKAYFGLLEILFNSHTEMVIAFDTPIFLQLVTSLEEGIKLDDVSLSSQICAALDHLCTYYFLQAKKNSPQAQKIQNHLKQSPDLFPRTLSLFFNMIMFQECSNQWSLSRTMLSLIVINPGFFEQLKQQITANIGGSEERQQKVREAFEKLMSGVEMDLEARNRDKFTGNLITFRSLIKEIL